MSVVKASVYVSKTQTLNRTINSLVHNSILDETCLDDKANKNNNKLIVKIVDTNGLSMSSEHRVAPNKSSDNQSSKNKTLPPQSSRILKNIFLFIKPTMDIKSASARRQNFRNFAKNIEVFTFTSLLVLFLLNLHLPFFIEINLRFDSQHNESNLERYLTDTFLKTNETRDFDLLRKSDTLQNIAMSLPLDNKSNSYVMNSTNITITIHPIDLYSTYECSR